MSAAEIIGSAKIENLSKFQIVEGKEE